VVLHLVDTGRQAIRSYASSAGDDVIDALVELAQPLQGARVLHVNATPYGGGVAEILRSEVPLLRDLGLLADWRLISGDTDFFAVTKRIHNGLQGASGELTADERATYLDQSHRNAELLEEQYDLVVVHDPQPLGLPALHGRGTARWVWRCHIDTSQPDPAVWTFLRGFLDAYDAAVFTLGGFVPPDLPVERVEVIPPAIDPRSPKNIELASNLARSVLEWIGVEVDRPLIAQISRFDRWKDPLGVVASYRLVRQEVPDLQLVLAGSMALDDPEGWGVYRELQDAVADDPEVHIFTNVTGVGNVEINAFQRVADVIVQKSIREGFGLVVSESLWKGTPVVAGRAGGIPLQLQDGAGGYLVDSVEACASRTLQLLRDRDHARELGRSGRELVRRRFLLTRLIADELRLYASLLGARPHAALPLGSGLANEDRDPVCGMRAGEGGRSRAFGAETFWFCSAVCENEFARDPDRFLRAAAGRVQLPTIGDEPARRRE
jgi:trehalose synthase